MINVPYLREIPEHEWVREVISERFQNATDLMTPNSVVYGGAVRDAVAGLELLGDLDIAVPAEEVSILRENFLGDTRWRARAQEKSPFQRVRSAGYADNVLNNIPMQDIIEFITFNDAIAQMVVSNVPSESMFDSALAIARQVDMVCCSMVLTYDGRIFETIEGAFQDCQNRILRINETSTTIHLDHVPGRINKLVKRGWTSLIDIEDTISKVKTARKREERDKLRKHASQARKNKKMFEAAMISRTRSKLIEDREMFEAAMMSRAKSKLSETKPISETFFSDLSSTKKRMRADEIASRLKITKCNETGSDGQNFNLILRIPFELYRYLNREEVANVAKSSLPEGRRNKIKLDLKYHEIGPKSWDVYATSYAVLIPFKNHLTSLLENKDINFVKSQTLKQLYGGVPDRIVKSTSGRIVKNREEGIQEVHKMNYDKIPKAFRR